MTRHDGSQPAAVAVTVLLERYMLEGCLGQSFCGRLDDLAVEVASKRDIDALTTVLPVVTNDEVRVPEAMNSKGTTFSWSAPRPRRMGQAAIPPPSRPVVVMRDLATLRRVLEGLRKMA